MGRMLSAYFKAFGQLSDAKTRVVVWLSIGWSIAIFIVLFILSSMALKATTFSSVAFLETLLVSLGQAAVVVVTWFLFPVVVTAVASLMLDRVAAAVEARHYPDLAPAPGQSYLESIGPALKFLGISVGLNLLALPLLLIPPLFPFVYYTLNGYLLSREYFELAALRRVSAHDAEALRTRWKHPLFIAGVGFAFMLTIPFLNLVAPIIATAVAVHLFEAWRTHDAIQDKPATSAISGDGRPRLDS